MQIYELKRGDYKHIKGFFRVQFEIPTGTLGDGDFPTLVRRFAEDSRFDLQLH